MNFLISPFSMQKAQFVSTFAGVYEHSPWVAEQVWQGGLNETHNCVTNLAESMRLVVEAASRQQQLDLICMHPDLAGKAAQSGALTAPSTNEQTGAGIDQSTAEELDQFQNFNQAYQVKFNFPFIMAVKGYDRHQILAAFAQRLVNTYEQEFNQALDQIHQIARFRLNTIAQLRA